MLLLNRLVFVITKNLFAARYYLQLLELIKNRSTQSKIKYTPASEREIKRTGESSPSLITFFIAAVSITVIDRHHLLLFPPIVSINNESTRAMNEWKKITNSWENPFFLCYYFFLRLHELSAVMVSRWSRDSLSMVKEWDQKGSEDRRLPMRNTQRSNLHGRRLIELWRELSNGMQVSASSAGCISWDEGIYPLAECITPRR